MRGYVKDHLTEDNETKDKDRPLDSNKGVNNRQQVADTTTKQRPRGGS